MPARARHTDPSTSHRAAAKIGSLRGSQQAVLVVLRTAGEPLLDEELIARYQTIAKAFHLPEQSDQSIRTRRAELAKMDPPLVIAGDRKKMTTGGTGLTWSAAPRQEDTTP